VNRVPEPERMAIHQAGHAVAQTLVGRERFGVSRVTLGSEENPAWPDREARGAASLDRETFLTIYEFGLVTLAGVAAEERYLAERPPEPEPLVALSDLAAWQERAGALFPEPGQLRLVSLNVMRKLHEWFADPSIWQTTETLAAELLEHEELEQNRLEQLLAPLAANTPTSKESQA